MARWFAICMVGDAVANGGVLGPFASKQEAGAAGAAWVEAQWQGEPDRHADDDLYAFDTYPEADVPPADVARAVLPR